MHIISGAYFSQSNCQWYTLSEVRTRASLVRLLWSVKTLISCPHIILLNSFSVSTIARSSISVTLYFCCVFDSFLLKNAIGLQKEFGPRSFGCVCVCLTSSREGLPSDAIPIAGRIHPPQCLRCHTLSRLCTSASPWEDVSWQVSVG